VDDVFWGFNHHLCGYKTVKTDVVNPKINYSQLLEVYDGIVFFLRDTIGMFDVLKVVQSCFDQTTFGNLPTRTHN